MTDTPTLYPKSSNGKPFRSMSARMLRINYPQCYISIDAYCIVCLGHFPLCFSLYKFTELSAHR